jgi:hypothetical protein
MVDIQRLFDDAVGDLEHAGGNGKVHEPRRPEIDDKLEFARPLHRYGAGLLALEDAINVAGGAPELVGKIRSIGDKAAVGDVDSSVVDRG